MTGQAGPEPAATAPASWAGQVELDGRGPIYEQIKRALTANIRSGRWPAGHRLPPEESLARHLGTARGTVHRALTRHQMVGSMGQVGSAVDNAAMESFFALLQRNVLNRHRWHTRDKLRIAIVTWIERTYHRRRRQRALGRLTPTEYETIMTPQPALAA